MRGAFSSKSQFALNSSSFNELTVDDEKSFFVNVLMDNTGYSFPNFIGLATSENLKNFSSEFIS